MSVFRARGAGGNAFPLCEGCSIVAGKIVGASSVNSGEFGEMFVRSLDQVKHKKKL